jgi:hypothetical protein
MQAPPAVEGMLLHGILHRAEGDFNNARAWIGDTRDACEGYQPKKKDDGIEIDADVKEKMRGANGIEGSLTHFVYGNEEPTKLVDDVETFRGKKRDAGEQEELEKRIREEMGKVLEWCKRKFGTEKMVDARSAWVKDSEEVQKISNDMVSGDKGHRKF